MFNSKSGINNVSIKNNSAFLVCQKNLQRILTIFQKQNLQKYKYKNSKPINSRFSENIVSSQLYLRLDKNELIKRAMTLGASSVLGKSNPRNLQNFCSEIYFRKLFIEYSDAKKHFLKANYSKRDSCKVDNANKIDRQTNIEKNQQADLLNFCLVNYDKLKSFAVGIVCLNENYYSVCVTIVLQEFIWKINEINVAVL
ncbi:MAG: hypothetical protein LBT91_03845 [Bifidobacteriaceae bacterium]|nr:hypothetical protein [Bifidobacteriaceae bacterium]